MFDIAFIMLFRVTAGDPWPEDFHAIRENGTPNWAVAVFIAAFTIIVIWVILQVSMAVLLDNFIGASSRIEMEERLEKAETEHREQQTVNPLEPLLLKLGREFSDNQDLSDRLQTLYQVTCR